MSNDVETLFAELSVSRSENTYNTVSHKGLQSLRTLPGMRDVALDSSTEGPASEPLPPTKVGSDTGDTKAGHRLGFSRVDKPGILDRARPTVPIPSVDKQPQFDRSQNFFVNVKTDTGQSTRVLVSWKSTIYQVKEQMQKLKGYTIGSQVLIYRGYQIFDNTTIGHYGIRQDSTIDLILGG
jgi:hypothetical protein